MPPPGVGAPMTAPQYIMAAAQSDQFEIQEGRIAESQAQSPSLRKFGAMMIRDHTMTTKTLQNAIMSTGMPVPPPPPLRPDQIQMIAQLRATGGAEFDRTYVMQQMQSHQQALMVQSSYARMGDAPALRGAASQTVPIVKAHIAMLNQMQPGMGQ